MTEAKRAYFREYYRKHRKEMIENQRRYTEKNKEKIALYQHERNLTHKEEKAAYNREYYRKQKLEAFKK